jgi:hypothetical protein
LKQEARSFHCPALQFPSNIEIRFSKVRTARKKKNKARRKLGKGGNVGEGLRKTGDLSLRDTSNFVLWEYSVSIVDHNHRFLLKSHLGRVSPYHSEFQDELFLSQLLSKKG